MILSSSREKISELHLYVNGYLDDGLISYIENEYSQTD